MERKQVIPFEECQDWHLYDGAGRNIGLAVFRRHEGQFASAFLGIRSKFGDQFIDAESHYGEGAPYGTYRPYKELGPLSPAARAMFERRTKVDKLYYSQDPNRTPDEKASLRKEVRTLNGRCRAWLRRKEKLLKKEEG